MYDHLTDDQRNQIRWEAERVTLEDCLMDSKFLKGIIESWCEGWSIFSLLETISDEEDVQTEVLGFNPLTGEEV